MKTTLVLPEPMVERIRRQAAREGRSMSAVVVDAMHAFFAAAKAPPSKPLVLPTFRMGPPVVDINDRDALYAAMEDE